MLLELENKGVVDLSHNWSVSSCLHHDSIHQSFLRELEEEGVIEVKWILGNNNSVDLFTKKVATKDFEKHTMNIVVMMNIWIWTNVDSQGEGVGMWHL
jgi:hypothetical protein